MAILAAATTEPGAALRQQNSRQISPLVLLSPILSHALQLQHVLSSATCLLFLRTYFAARVVATALLLASRVIAFRAFMTSRFLAVRVTGLSQRLSRSFWSSSQSRRFRKNFELELYHLLLGPLGNALFLMLFWPGWLVLAVIIRALWP